MTQTAKAQSIIFCEVIIALLCSYVAAAVAAESVISSVSILYNLTGVRGFYQLLWLGYDDAWSLFLLAVCSFISAFGLLDRVTVRWLINGEWRLNWMALPFVGIVIYELNLAWYFTNVFEELLRPLNLLGVALGGGVLLTGVSCPVWLAGFAYRTVKHELDEAKPLP
jgi:hypothetical protein